MLLRVATLSAAVSAELSFRGRNEVLYDLIRKVESCLQESLGQTKVQDLNPSDIAKCAQSIDTQNESNRERTIQLNRGAERNPSFVVGHKAPDVDAIASAIGAASLYGGTATRAELDVEDLNGEVQFSLALSGLPAPELFSGVWTSGKNVLLVDHNEYKQMPDVLDVKDIVGLIDHHALSAAFAIEFAINDSTGTESPADIQIMMARQGIYVEMRPWGSAATIVARNFIVNEVLMRKEVARVLLCAIISDTLNLSSGTTTDMDRMMVAALWEIGKMEEQPRIVVQKPWVGTNEAPQGNYENVKQLADDLFKHKTLKIVSQTSMQMVQADQKEFGLKDQNGKDVKVGIAVLEVTDVELVFQSPDGAIEKLAAAMDTLKQKNEYQAMFLFVVDVVKKESSLVILSEDEKNVLEHIPQSKSKLDGLAPTRINLGSPYVSRKLEFKPMIEGAVKQMTWNRVAAA